MREGDRGGGEERGRRREGRKEGQIKNEVGGRRLEYAWAARKQGIPLTYTTRTVSGMITSQASSSN